jgi:beta-lactam-binding protein with PASTA domain
VLAVTPAEGETAALNQDITVSYATGLSPVPILTGRVRSQAESDARAAGFDKVKFVTKESDQVEGLVIDQDPEQGKRVPRSTEIELTVATAPEPAPPPPSSTAPSTPAPEPSDPATTASPSASASEKSPEPQQSPSETPGG